MGGFQNSLVHSDFNIVVELNTKRKPCELDNTPLVMNNPILPLEDTIPDTSFTYPHCRFFKDHLINGYTKVLNQNKCTICFDGECSFNFHHKIFCTDAQKEDSKTHDSVTLISELLFIQLHLFHNTFILFFHIYLFHCFKMNLSTKRN